MTKEGQHPGGHKLVRHYPAVSSSEGLLYALSGTTSCCWLIPLQRTGRQQERLSANQVFIFIIQCLEYRRLLMVNFIDFKKPFDSIYQESLRNILHLCGFLLKFISVFKSLYCCIRMDMGHTDFFNAEIGFRQRRRKLRQGQMQTSCWMGRVDSPALPSQTTLSWYQKEDTISRT